MDRRAWLLGVAGFFLVGCGGPPVTIDTSTDATTEASLKAMKAGMSDAEKKRFEEGVHLRTRELGDSRPLEHQRNGVLDEVETTDARNIVSSTLDRSGRDRHRIESAVNHPRLDPG